MATAEMTAAHTANTDEGEEAPKKVGAKRGRKSKKSYLENLSETTGAKVTKLGSVPAVPDEFDPAIYAPLKEVEFEDSLHFWEFQSAYHTYFLSKATTKADELRAMDPAVRNDFASVMKTTDMVINRLRELIAKGHNVEGVFAKIQAGVSAS